MLRIDKNDKKLVRLKPSALAEADHWERQLQAMICAAPDAFCEEIGERLWLIGQEVRPSDAVSDRIDILAVDDAGVVVVIELKRGSHKLQLFQAVSYAGMVSRWPAERFIETLAATASESVDDARAALEQHIGPDIASINSAQRILLIAEDFDPALLFATEWLHDNFGVDIRCYRLQLSQENGTDYLTCTCIYPPIEIATLTRGSTNALATSTAYENWDAALDAVENTALTAFVRAALANHQEARLPYRQVIYRFGGKRRFWLNIRTKYAYMWQGGRFDGDDAYWKTRLSEPGYVQAVNEARGLRFRLITAADFATFATAIGTDLTTVVFSESSEAEPTLDSD